MSKTPKLQFYLPCYYHICVINKYALQRQYILTIHVQIRDNYVVYIPHMNSLQSTMSPGTLIYIHFTLLAYAPKQICLLNHTHMSHFTTTVVYI